MNQGHTCVAIFTGKDIVRTVAEWTRKYGATEKNGMTTEITSANGKGKTMTTVMDMEGDMGTAVTVVETGETDMAMKKEGTGTNTCFY